MPRSLIPFFVFTFYLSSVKSEPCPKEQFMNEIAFQIGQNILERREDIKSGVLKCFPAALTPMDVNFDNCLERDLVNAELVKVSYESYLANLLLAREQVLNCGQARKALEDRTAEKNISQRDMEIFVDYYSDAKNESLRIFFE